MGVTERQWRRAHYVEPPTLGFGYIILFQVLSYLDRVGSKAQDINCLASSILKMRNKHNMENWTIFLPSIPSRKEHFPLMHFKANFSNIIFPNLIQYLWKGIKKFVVREKTPIAFLHSVGKMHFLLVLLWSSVENPTIMQFPIKELNKLQYENL